MYSRFFKMTEFKQMCATCHEESNSIWKQWMMSHHVDMPIQFFLPLFFSFLIIISSVPFFFLYHDTIKTAVSVIQKTFVGTGGKNIDFCANGKYVIMHSKQSNGYSSPDYFTSIDNRSSALQVSVGGICMFR